MSLIFSNASLPKRPKGLRARRKRAFNCIADDVLIYLLQFLEFKNLINVRSISFRWRGCSKKAIILTTEIDLLTHHRPLSDAHHDRSAEIISKHCARLQHFCLPAAQDPDLYTFKMVTRKCKNLQSLSWKFHPIPSVQSDTVRGFVDCLLASKQYLRALEINDDQHLLRSTDFLTLLEKSKGTHLGALKLSAIGNKTSPTCLFQFLSDGCPRLRVLILELYETTANELSNAISGLTPEHFSDLRYLSLSKSSINDAICGQLKEILVHLEYLDVSKNQITNVGFDSLVAMDGLLVLNIFRTWMDFRIIETLKNPQTFPLLHTLYITDLDSMIKKVNVDELKEVRPEIQIERKAPREVKFRDVWRPYVKLSNLPRDELSREKRVQQKESEQNRISKGSWLKLRLSADKHLL